MLEGTGEQYARVGELELCYETFGDRAMPALLLVMGLGSQMLLWQEDFCEQLAQRGFWVIRFDNRDVGRSTHARFRPPSLFAMLRGRFPAGQYDLTDLATDTAGLRYLDRLAVIARTI